MAFKPGLISKLDFKYYLRKHCIDQDILKHLEVVPKEVGSFGHDPWGYSREGLACGLTLFRKFYEHYFRTEVFGLENVPSSGRLLVIANHSGQLPLDGMMVGYSMIMNKDNPRAARAMVERWVPTVPFIGNLINGLGAVVGDPMNCSKMLRREEAVIVFPEGIRGSGKLIKDKYKLQRFGTGFMHLAINEKTPIIPVGIVGCEETFPAIANIKPLAKALKMPYFPVMPPVPFPAKVRLYFGKPKLYTADTSSEVEIAEQVEDVKKDIRALIDQGLSARKGWFE